MSVKKDMAQVAYEIFAKLHPVECYDLDKAKFCKFMRDEGYNLTDTQIDNLINETK